MLGDPLARLRSETARRARGPHCLRFAMNWRYDFIALGA
ncbi:hypothetical protein Nhal_2209 [Nitrosococcus halophilus Nc 4]|uniref:Uncharacterized protein n=1 Tax=Nitrosococcus halophilus (strain Nc4) TaxID=472759 RepID=D5C577_NITHN|nr:hypothetical protein Nhal_2209 [Nitrosococcus halophilus Nc 4]